MRLPPIGDSGSWLVAAAISLAGHAVIATAIVRLSGDPYHQDSPPITVELVVLKNAKPQREAPTGDSPADNFQIHSAVMTMARLSTPLLPPPRPDSEPLTRDTSVGIDDLLLSTVIKTPSRELSEPGISENRAQELKHWAPIDDAMLREITGTDAEETSLTPSASLSERAGADAPREMAIIAPDAAQHIQPAEPASALHLPQPKPSPPKTNTPAAPEVALPSTVSIAPTEELALPVARNPANDGAPEEDSQALEQVLDTHTPSNASATPRPDDETGRIDMASNDSVQVAVATQPLPKPASITRGVQVVSGNRPPRYPLAARRLGMEGRVLLRVEVDSSGLANRVTVTESSGQKILDESARRTVSTWQFLPAMVNGISVSGAVDVPITFRLD